MEEVECEGGAGGRCAASRAVKYVQFFPTAELPVTWVDARRGDSGREEGNGTPGSEIRFIRRDVTPEDPV